MSRTSRRLSWVLSSKKALFSGPCGIVILTSAAQFTLRPISGLLRIHSAQPFYQSCEFYKIRNPEECALPSYDYLWIGLSEIRPLWGNGKDSRVVMNLKQEPLTGTVTPLTHPGELSPAERMEGVSNSHKARRSDVSVCILDRVTNGWPGGNSAIGRKARRNRAGSWRPTPYRSSSGGATSRRLRGCRPGNRWSLRPRNLS